MLGPVSAKAVPCALGIAIAIAGNPRLARADTVCRSRFLNGTAALIEPGIAAALIGQDGGFLAQAIDTRTMAPASTGTFLEIDRGLPSHYFLGASFRNVLASSPDGEAYVIWARQPVSGSGVVLNMTTGDTSRLTGKDDVGTALEVVLGSGGEGWALAVTTPSLLDGNSVLHLLHTTGYSPDPWAVVGETPATECDTAFMSIALASDGTAFGTCGEKAFRSTGADFQLVPMGGPTTRAVASLDATGAPMLVAVTQTGVQTAAWDGTVWVWQETINFGSRYSGDSKVVVVPASGVVLVGPGGGEVWGLSFAAWDAPSGPLERVGEVRGSHGDASATAAGPPVEIIAVGDTVVHFARNGGEWKQTIMSNLDHEEQCPLYTREGGCSCSINAGLPSSTTGDSEAILGLILAFLARRRSTSIRRR